MDNLKKLSIIIIRLQALAIILVGLIYWAVIAGNIILASVKNIPTTPDGYAGYAISSACHLLVGIILYARSRSLAVYFIRGVEND